MNKFKNIIDKIKNLRFTRLDLAEKNNKSNRKTVEKSLNITSIILTISTSICLCLLVVKYVNNKNTLEELENSLVLKNSSYSSVLDEINSVKSKYNNDNIVGLLDLENTDYSIPIVKYTDNDYYLSHSLYNKKSKIGSTFIDYRVNLDSKQINIYGHNSTKYDTPFKLLESYLDEDFVKENKYIELKIGNEKRIYEVFSVIIAKESSKEEHMKLSYNDSNEWLDHFNRLKDKSIYDLDVTLEDKDNILVLQTCLFGRYSGKLLVVVYKEIYSK